MAEAVSEMPETGAGPPPASAAVAVVGAGPAGLAAATRLRALGVDDVVVLERESETGGVPRHCGHRVFGLREYRRLLTGPEYARALRERAGAHGVTVCRASVVRVEDGGRLLLSTPAGAAELQARCVLLATGARETPRAARLVGGTRPPGVLTTAALQMMVYLHRHRPFRRPVVVGTELVSFSALLTCRHAGIRPAAMLEAGARPTAWRFSPLLPLALGVPLYYRTRLLSILGRERVEGVILADGDGRERTLDCDGVIFSGRFLPEASLLKAGHLQVDPGSGGPRVDQYGRCSDPVYFACGNLLRPVETAGWSWREGSRTADDIAASLAGRLPPPARSVEIALANEDRALKYALPQRIALPYTGAGMPHIQLRFMAAAPARGRLTVRDGQRLLWSRRLRALPERRILIPLAALAQAVTATETDTTRLSIGFD